MKNGDKNNGGDSGFEFDFGSDKGFAGDDETPWFETEEEANENYERERRARAMQQETANALPNRDIRGNYSNPPRNSGKGKRVAYILGGVGISVFSFFAGFFTYSAAMDKELRSLIKIKNTIQSEYYEEITDEEFYGALFDAVNENLLDDYSWYMDGDEFAEFIREGTGEWSGLGLAFSVRGENGEPRMLITSVSGNSPAESAGIMEGSLIVGYGESETTLIYDTEFENFQVFLSEKQKGEEITLCLETAGTRQFVQIAKSTFMENYVFYRSQTTAYRFVGEDALDKESYAGELPALGGETAYIRLTQFNGNAAAQFKMAMAAFKEEGKKNLVLDLRGNGGGYLDILQEIAAYFCKNSNEKKPIAATAKSRDGKTETFRASGNWYGEYFSADSKIYLLADDGTASASECLIGAMLDYGACGYEDICLSYRGGMAKTYGKGIMQSTYPFGLIGNVDAIKLTTAKIYWPVSGNCIHGVGVTVENGCKTVQEGVGDAEINAALQLLLGV